MTKTIRIHTSDDERNQLKPSIAETTARLSLTKPSKVDEQRHCEETDNLPGNIVSSGSIWLHHPPSSPSYSVRADLHLVRHDAKNCQPAPLQMAGASEQMRKDKIKQQSEQLLIVSVERDQAQKNYDLINRQMVARLPKSPFSDRTIADTYQDLCQSIEDWVDMNCGYIESFAAIHDSSAWTTSDQQLLMNLLDNGGTISVARTFPKCSTYIVMRLVMRFLFEKLLRRSRWLPGMSEEQEELLAQTFGHLPDAFPTRDAESRGASKCDFYTSLVKSGYLQDRRSNYLHEHLMQLLRIVTTFADKAQAIDVKGLERIVNAAAELANMIRLSPMMYYLIHGFAPQMLAGDRQLKARTFKDYMAIDAEKGTWVRRSAQSDGGQSNMEGEIFSTVFPTLIRATVHGGIVRIAQGLVIASIKEQTSFPVAGEDCQSSSSMKAVEQAHVSRGPAESMDKPNHKSWAAVAKGTG